MSGRWTVDVSMCIKIDDDTDIRSHACADGEVEFYIGGPDALVLVTTEQGWKNLVASGNAALRDQPAAERSD